MSGAGVATGQSGAEREAPRYVVHDERRWSVLGVTDLDGEPAYELARTFRGGFQGRHQRKQEIVARVRECQPWQHSGRRKIVGPVPHRQGRQVVFEFTPPNLVRLRLKGKRQGYDVTLEGLFDLAARQAAANAQRERAFRRRTGQRR